MATEDKKPLEKDKLPLDETINAYREIESQQQSNKSRTDLKEQFAFPEEIWEKLNKKGT